MVRLRTIGLWLSLSGVFVACNDAPVAPVAAKDSVASPIPAPIVEAAFKNGSREITAPALDSIFERQGESYHEEIVLTDTLSSGKVIVVTSIVPQGYGCHACGALLKGYEWSNTGKPELNKEYYLGLHGSFGSPGPVSIRPIGKDAFAYFIEDGFTNMGITVVDRTIMMPVNNKAAELLYLDESDMTNEGDCDSAANNCYSYKTVIKIDSTTVGPVYDLLVHKKGTNLLPEKSVVSIDSLLRYRFDGKRYRLYP